jgi:glucose-1-phosphate adenylyltransferase
MDKISPQQLARRTIALVLAGGRGSRLQALTDRRTKPAVYFGGKFRIIDFALSNCLNSGVRRIGVLTQYKSHSLLRHLQRGWSFLRNEFNEFIDLLPAQQRMDDESWYLGTADAVYQNLDILRAHKPEYILVLAGDHIYKMDYSQLIADHVAQGKACTVGCIEVPLAEASAFGVMAIDDQRRIVSFAEKPAHPAPMPGRPDMALASMGIYVFDAQALFDALASRCHRTRLHPRLWQRHHSRRWWRKARPWPTRLACRASKAVPMRPATGATWARWTPTGRPTSI